MTLGQTPCHTTATTHHIRDEIIPVILPNIGMAPTQRLEVLSMYLNCMPSRRIFGILDRYPIKPSSDACKNQRGGSWIYPPRQRNHLLSATTSVVANTVLYIFGRRRGRELLYSWLSTGYVLARQSASNLCCCCFRV